MSSRVNLEVGLALVAHVEDRLDERMGQPLLRIRGGEERAGDRKAFRSVTFLGDEAHLADGLVEVRLVPGEAPGESAVEVRRSGARHRELLVPDPPACLSLLEQSGERVRLHLPLGTADAAEVAAGALVDRQTARHLDHENRRGRFLMFCAPFVQVAG